MEVFSLENVVSSIKCNGIKVLAFVLVLCLTCMFGMTFLSSAAYADSVSSDFEIDVVSEWDLFVDVVGVIPVVGDWSSWIQLGYDFLMYLANKFPVLQSTPSEVLYDVWRTVANKTGLSSDDFSTYWNKSLEELDEDDEMRFLVVDIPLPGVLQYSYGDVEAEGLDGVVDTMTSSVKGVFSIAGAGFDFLTSNDLCMFMISISFAGVALSFVRRSFKTARK